MEEDIEVLEEFIKYFEAEAISRKYRRNISITVGEDDIQAIENLIKGYRELEEENKYYKNKFEIVHADSLPKDMQFVIYTKEVFDKFRKIQQEYLGNEHENVRDVKIEGFIPKSKVKEKIEFYEKNFNMVGASSKVNVLKELLMEDK